MDQDARKPFALDKSHTARGELRNLEVMLAVKDSRRRRCPSQRNSELGITVRTAGRKVMPSSLWLNEDGKPITTFASPLIDRTKGSIRDERENRAGWPKLARRGVDLNLRPYLVHSRTLYLTMHGDWRNRGRDHRTLRVLR